MLNIEWILMYSFLGFFVGFMGGLLGVGGGGILVPLLTSSFIYQGLPADSVVHLALGTSLASMIISSLASIHAHNSRGTVVWNVASGLATGITVGVSVVTRVAVNINSKYIAGFFAFFMALVALQMFLNWQPKVSRTQIRFRGLFLAGTLVGAVSSLAAVGGGVLTVMYLCYKNIDIKKAVGTSAAIGLPIAVTGTVGYLANGWSITSSNPYTLGFVYVPAFLIISVMSAIAAPFGARCSYNLPENRLKKIFAFLCLILSVNMLLHLFWIN